MEANKERKKTAPGSKKNASAAKRYFEAVGRRKTSVARVRIIENQKRTSDFVVNKKKFDSYFPTEELHTIIREPLQKIKVLQRFSVSAQITGGGVHSQAEALRHGLARALVLFNNEWRGRLKKGGLLKRDPRMIERKKFGKKKARKSPQWSKR